MAFVARNLFLRHTNLNDGTQERIQEDLTDDNDDAGTFDWHARIGRQVPLMFKQLGEMTAVHSNMATISQSYKISFMLGKK
jgi:hypothetical protein